MLKFLIFNEKLLIQFVAIKSIIYLHKNDLKKLWKIKVNDTKKKQKPKIQVCTYQ